MNENEPEIIEESNFTEIESEKISGEENSENNILIANKYLVDVSKLLNGDNIYCDIYSATDTQSDIEANKNKYLAYIFNPKLPLRMKALSLLKNYHDANLIIPIISDKTYMADRKKICFTIVSKRPKGISLFEYITKNGSETENFLVNILLPGLCKILEELQSIGMSHGSINPNNIYIDDDKNIILGECFSSSSGFNQPSCYEPLDRMLCHPIGKGEPTILTDCFAIGMVALFVVTGQDPQTLISSEEVTKNRLKIGSYQFFIPNYTNFSNRERDLFKGLLSDKKTERWKFTHIRDWCHNRRYAIINNLDNGEASRNIIFNSKHYGNYKSLSYAMWKEWDEARLFLKEDALIKWVETSLADTEKAEKLHYILRPRDKSSKNTLQEDENLARAILILNPENPILFKEIACDLEGISFLLAYSFANKKKEIADNLVKIILHNIWRGSTAGINNDFRKEVISNVEIIDNYLMKRKLGFGIERSLYELSPELSCQSNLIEGNFVNNLTDLLAFLNKKAGESNMEIIDNHLAAFLASKLKIIDEIKLNSTPEFIRFERNKDLIALFLLSSAQKIAKVQSLNNLSNLIVGKLQSALNLIYNKKIKATLMSQLDELKNKGDLVEIYRIIANPVYIKTDKQGFDDASLRYEKLDEQIENINQPQKIYEIGYKYGLKLSVIISYFIVLIFFASLLSKYIH